MQKSCHLLRAHSYTAARLQSHSASGNSRASKIQVSDVEPLTNMPMPDLL